MSNKLYLCIKKTNQHLYAYVLHNGKQLLTVSTNQKMIKKNIEQIDSQRFPEIIGYLLSEKIKESGLSNIYLKKTYIFHGKVKTVVEELRKNGIIIF
uniref:Ribosomal protein L18 n=1 Tax=Reclinomonas americana ATCC 50284 TaxID=1295595 RepID=M4QAL0_RECAM|nr:ribosomal protein L18 [Reclinomonas americana ATCC 50284]